jgi:type I pantothenate kinase
VTSAVTEIADAVLAAPASTAGGSPAPTLVGIAGSVAVGKTTLAEEVARHLRDDHGRRVAVLATDCFLLPNAELGRRGLTMQKGFPASYDDVAIERFLVDANAGRPAEVPVYSHAIYDRVPGATAVVGPAEVVVIEGVNALRPPLRPALDVAVYLDADEDDIRRWYVDRFLALIAEAEADETSFYRMFVSLVPDDRRAMAESTWTGINAVNLHEHIEPTKASATLVLRKRGDHSLHPT